MFKNAHLLHHTMASRSSTTMATRRITNVAVPNDAPITTGDVPLEAGDGRRVRYDEREGGDGCKRVGVVRGWEWEGVGGVIR